MNNSLIWVSMLVTSFVMLWIPSVYFVTLKAMMGLSVASGPLAVVGAVLLSVLIVAGAAVYTCYVTQKSNCGGVKNVRSIALSTVYAIIIQFLALAIGLFMPGLHDIVSLYWKGPTTYGTEEAMNSTAIDMGFWGAWGAAYAIAVGGTLAGVC